jgi:hypothetical protein
MSAFAPFVYTLAKSMGGTPLKYIPKDNGCAILMTDGRKVHFDEHQIEKAKETKVPTARIVTLHDHDAPTQPREIIQLASDDKKQSGRKR